MPSENNKIESPPDWGGDGLSSISQLLIGNEWATFVHSADWHKGLSDIFEALTKCNAELVYGVLKRPDQIARLLAITATNHWVAAARTAEAGHCLPTYATGRAATEMALYAWYMTHDQSAAARWATKPDAADRNAFRAWSKEFSVAPIARELAKCSNDGAKWAKDLHQTAIDFGAHPNSVALFSNLSHKPIGNGKSLLNLTYVHADGDLFLASLKYAFEVGLFVIAMIRLAFPEMRQTTELSSCLDRLTAELTNLVAAYHSERGASKDA
ncbi:hypothetical protein PCA31118_02711 [Pandoraea captiosa]|uniref:Uncharacterized protein n=1 Tax=Pandoraea captiosa TaxID=2508302 RepID=A0A5E5A2U6_9BURK|nr:hypothetical protein [Pandoraea captiosa]VVE67924.1 hypothetical protein PCA31118_02711 [Pandoraea captiosa]